MTDTHDLTLENRKWKHRRRMSYIALAYLGAIITKGVLDPEGAAQAGELLHYTAYASAAIVLGYFGTATFQHFGKKSS